MSEALDICCANLQGWQKERRQSAALQKDLDFYKASSAQAIAERDSLAFEVQSCKDNLAATTAALQDTKSQLSLVQQLSADLQGKMASVKQQLETEQREAASCRVQLKQQKQKHEQQMQQLRAKQVQQEQQLQEQGAEHKAVQVRESTKSKLACFMGHMATWHCAQHHLVQCAPTCAADVKDGCGISSTWGSPPSALFVGVPTYALLGAQPCQLPRVHM